jgi:ribonuclease HII
VVYTIVFAPFYVVTMGVKPMVDTFFFERRLHRDGLVPVAGVDEAGRGPLAGPVVAAAVILPVDLDHSPFKDSKKLTAKGRDRVFALLEQLQVPMAVGVCTAQEIDEINILQASLLAMKRAVEKLSLSPAFLLVDGKFTIHMDLPQEAMIKGESKSASIAAASVVAKVSRDRIMRDYDEKYPLYNFRQHKGYPTKAHRSLVAQHGPCPIHRMTFKGVQESV